MTDTDQNWIALDNTGLVSTLKKKLVSWGHPPGLKPPTMERGPNGTHKSSSCHLLHMGNIETSKSQTMLITNHCTGRILGCGTPILGHVVTWQAMFARANTCSWQWKMHFLWLLYVQSPFPIATCQVSHWSSVFAFSPRASQRRVLLTVGVCQTFSHLHIFPSHLQILTSSSSSHPHIFTSSHLHIFSSSHLLIFTSAHPHIFSSSHLLIFTSSHLLILTSSPSSHLTSSHLHIFSSSHLLIFTSHLLIFTSSHLHIFTWSHHHIFTCSHLHILSCPLALCPLLLLLSISLLRRGAVPTRRHETQNPFARNKVGSPKQK